MNCMLLPSQLLFCMCWHPQVPTGKKKFELVRICEEGGYKGVLRSCGGACPAKSTVADWAATLKCGGNLRPSGRPTYLKAEQEVLVKKAVEEIWLPGGCGGQRGRGGIGEGCSWEWWRAWEHGEGLGKVCIDLPLRCSGSLFFVL